MAMEGVAVTVFSIDRANGIISTVIVEIGASTNLIKNFKAGEPCVFMGPTGKKVEVPENETVVIVGGGGGNPPLAAIANLFKQHGCKVIFFAGYRKNSLVALQEKMENSCDILVYSIQEEAPNLKLNRPQDQQIHGLVTDALRDYFSKNPQKIDRIFTIGNNKMMDAIARLRNENQIESLSQAPVAIASLNAPMQCMLKGICSQCLQKRIDENGEEEYFYACVEQDQNMDRLDFKHLHNRCEQNSLSEKISKMWLENLSLSC
jgi:NAD(P)H-flavin reductase